MVEVIILTVTILVYPVFNFFYLNLASSVYEELEELEEKGLEGSEAYDGILDRYSKVYNVAKMMRRLSFLMYISILVYLLYG